MVDLEKLRRNVRDMARLASGQGVALRPHVKTHKCLEIAALQREAGAAGISVATIGEAETFVRGGFRDVFIAYPVFVDRPAAARLHALAAEATVAVGLDSVAAAETMAETLGPDRERIRVVLEVDCGQHRSGARPTEVGALGAAAATLGLAVHGVFTFPGHSYAPDAQGSAAAQEAEALDDAAAALRTNSIEPIVVSGGSTPSVRSSVPGVITELRPGVYVFGDAQQLELGTMPWDAIALWASSTVVSHSGGNVVLDAGSKCLGADRAPWATGHGRVLDTPDARIVHLSEHHAVVAWPPGAERPPIGSRLRVVPNHVCNAVNLVDRLHVLDHDTMQGPWVVAARGANS